jgi:hypothetical protein
VRAKSSLQVCVLDASGKYGIAGAEVRLYVAGARRLLATRFTDSGSGYDAQSDMPVHFGLGTAARVDVEVSVPNGSARGTTDARGISPTSIAGHQLKVRARIAERKTVQRAALRSPSR